MIRRLGLYSSRSLRALLARWGACTLLLTTAGAAWAQAPGQAPPVQAPIEAGSLSGSHPAEYYLKAGQLFKDGRKDDAVFVFYLGQLRYRAHLMARPNLPRSGDAAAFASLSEMLGRPINQYAFGDIPQLARTIDAVLAFDAANPDGFTPPAQFAQAYAEVRDGLHKLKAHILQNADSIRATRAKNGLANRSK